MSFEKAIDYAGGDSAFVKLYEPTEAGVWLIELCNKDDSRLVPKLLASLRAALTTIEDAWMAKEGERHGAVILVGNRKQDKFFSNGLDFANSSKDRHFFMNQYNPTMERLITFPLPIIAAVNGHCFAGGMMLALSCDYRVMLDGSKRRAWMCMNEIHFGAPIPPSFATLFKVKFQQTQAVRSVFLEGKRFTPQEALKIGFVDAIVPGGTAEAIQKALEIANSVVTLPKTGVYGAIKEEFHLDVVKLIQSERSDEYSPGVVAKL